MDDFKENNGIEPIPEEETVAGGDKPQGDETENTAQPEEIQEETVKPETPEEDGIPITPQEDGEEPNADEMCILCGEKPADKSFGENYDLCADCRKSLIKSPMRFSGFLAIITLFCIGVWGLMFTVNQADTLAVVLDGDDAYASNHLYQAVDCYSQGGNIGWKTAKRMVKAYNDSGYLNGISGAVSTYFYDASTLEEGEKLTFADKAGKANLNAPWNKDIKQITTEYTTAMTAYQTYYAYISSYDEQLYYGEITAEDVPYDEVLAKLEAAKSETNEKADLAFINYCQYYLASICEKGTQTQYDYLNAAAAAAPDYGWLYLTPLAELNIKLGNYDEALENCAALEKANADDVYGEYYRTQIYRMKGDYKTALEKAEAMIADYDSTGFYYAYYEAAIDAFLLGDYDKSYEYSSECFSGTYQNLQTVNFHALVSKKKGDEDGYKAAVELLESVGYEISPTVAEYFDGKVTAEELFNEREVAFE